MAGRASGSLERTTTWSSAAAAAGRGCSPRSPGRSASWTSAHAGYADVELRSLGLCVFTYQWTGTAYAKAASRDCPFAAPPSVGDVATHLR